MTGRHTGTDAWLRRTPQGHLYSWLASVPGAIVYNTPAYRLHEELQLHTENRVLDIGCGRGALLQLLSSHIAFRHPPIGIDVSRAMLTQDGQTPQVERLQAGGTALPFASDTFDLVTCGYVASRLEADGLLALMREVRRVLAPGGIALLWDFAPTSSNALNAFHERVLTVLGRGPVLRGYATLSLFALEAGFEWVSNAHLRPFLFPPIPRASILTGKAPIGWEPPGTAPGLTPDTHARTIVAGVTQEPPAGPASDTERG